MASVKVREIARQLSISPGTVSKALNGRPGQVSAETTKLVLDHCCAQGYMDKSEAGQILLKKAASNNGQQIFVLTNSHGVLVYDAIFAGICEQLQRNDLFPSSYLISDDESINRFPYEKAGCAIIIGRASKKLLKQMNEHKVPVVLADNKIAGDKVSAVNTNNSDAVSESIQILVNKGHKRIAFVCNYEDSNTYTFHQRHAGYVAGMSIAGLPLQDDLQIIDEVGDYNKADFDWEQCTKDLNTLCRRILDINPMPTAVIAANDITAYTLRDVLIEKGLRVPEDISIIGYDGRHKLSADSTGYSPVSSQVVNWHELGREAVVLALNMLYDPDLGPRYLEVPTKYEDAGTVAEPKQ